MLETPSLNLKKILFNNKNFTTKKIRFSHRFFLDPPTNLFLDYLQHVVPPPQKNILDPSLTFLADPSING